MIIFVILWRIILTHSLSETSQKLNQDFGTNIMIDGYKTPFVQGSKFNKGGVAIYTKDDKCF